MHAIVADRELAALATRQHGVVSRAQLVELGLTRHGITHRLANGRLLPLHRGVYAVGHRAVSRDGRWLAAVLAVGPGAVLSHRSAAALWGMRATNRARVEVTVERAVRARTGLQIHRADVPADEATQRDGIPVTTVPRTLADLASVLRPSDLRRAAEQAEALRLGDPLSLDALLDRHRGRTGAGRLRAIVAEGVAPTVTRSELERRFLAAVEAHGLPAPAVNLPVRLDGGWLELDFAWPARCVAVELDGYAHHGTRAAFERDRERDRRLQAAGWRVIRVTWRQLRDDPEAIARDLARLLA